jgi:transposase
MLVKQTKLRTGVVRPNRNISFPFGTIVAVSEYFDKLGFSDIFSRHKSKGFSINSLVKALLSYKLTENFSITRARDWINRKEVLKMFELEPFEQRTLFRVFETIGENKERIVYDIQDCLLEHYDFEHTDINMDWTSLILFGDKSTLGKYGYSRDHRPDKKQITIGLSELASPINIPIGITIKEGNVPDVVHFDDTYEQVKGILRDGSRIIFDKGAHSYENIENIQLDGKKYLTVIIEQER